jgi:hypothetical protein
LNLRSEPAKGTSVHVAVPWAVLHPSADE